MKIGFSFGRCVRDIVNGEVDIKDVMCIIARTHMEEKEHVEHVIHAYRDRYGYLMGLSLDKCLEVGLELWQSGRVIEPRANGIYAMSVPSEYIWMDLYPTVPNVQTEAVKEAWNAYRVLIELTEQVPEGSKEDLGQLKHGAKLTPEKKADVELLLNNVV